ncbi:MAG TPA: hypothetical protein VF144_16890 [Chitinophagaceae bacterium]
MKKQIVLVIIIIDCLSSQSQNAIKTDVPCTDSMAYNAKGRWIRSPNQKPTNSKEIDTRLEKIRQMLLNIYPQPTGIDAVWSFGAAISVFGSKRKYYKRDDDRLTFDHLNIPHFSQFSYGVNFFKYYCDYSDKKKLNTGYPGETGTMFGIVANFKLGDPHVGDDWTINGLPVMDWLPAKEKRDGFEIAHRGYPEWQVANALIHRKGILPYLPVTRRQYLERCTIYNTHLHDESIKDLEKLLATAKEADKKWINDKLSRAKKYREQEFKKFADALQETTEKGLLDSPAIIRVRYLSSPVFENDPYYSGMLITENPDYIRKELPKHIPQFFLISWRCQEALPQKKVGEIISRYFPFEKLEAMIDK